MGNYPEVHRDITMINEKISLDSLRLQVAFENLSQRGMTLVSYESGIEKDWLEIQRQADLFNEFEDDRFFTEFGNDQTALGERMFFILNSKGDAIATSSVWYPQKDWSEDFGRIHWVAVLPEYQGQGLSHALMCENIKRLLALNCSKSYLTTNTARERAIKLYQSYHFEII